MNMFSLMLLALVAMCGGLTIVPETVDMDKTADVDHVSPIANADFGVCRKLLSHVHSRAAGKDSQTILQEISIVRERLGAHERHACDHFLEANSEEIVSLLQTEEMQMQPCQDNIRDQIADDLAANPGKTVQEFESSYMCKYVPKVDNAATFKTVDKGQMTAFWEEKGQYCSSCLGLAGRLTRYINKNTTQLSLHQKLTGLCTVLPKDLVGSCTTNMKVWGTSVIKQYFAKEKLPYLCLRAGLCEATVVVMPKYSAQSAAVPLAGYTIKRPDGKPYEPVFIPPKGLTKPVITFPKDKSKPITLNFVPKKVYDMEPEVTLNKNQFYDPSKLDGGMDSLVLDKRRYAEVLMAKAPGPPPPKYQRSTSFPIQPGFLQVEEQQEPEIEAPNTVDKIETNYPDPKDNGIDLSGESNTAMKMPANLGGAAVYKFAGVTPNMDTMWDMGTGSDMENKIRIGPMHLEDPSVEINAGNGGKALTEEIETYAVGGDMCAGISATQLAGGSGPALKCLMQKTGGMGPALPQTASGGTTAMPWAIRGATPMPYGRACATCTFLLTSLEEFMKHSRTLRAVLPTVSGMCERCITRDEEGRCRNLIKKHGYKMYEILVSRASAVNFCPSLGYCFENYFMPSPYSLAGDFAAWKSGQNEMDKKFVAENNNLPM